MKTKPCKHPKSERYVRWQDSEVHWGIETSPWGIVETPGHASPKKLHVYCTKCGKKLREVEVKK